MSQRIRRHSIRRAAAGAAVIVAGVGATLLVSGTRARAAANQRSYTAGNVVLQLGNEIAAVKELSGGNYTGDVVVERVGANSTFPNKHLAGIHVVPIEAKIAPTDFASFLAGQIGNNVSRVNGAVQFADYNYQIKDQIQFTNALLSGLQIPELSGGSKDAAYLGLTLEPEHVQDATGGGSAKTPIGGKQKAVLASNFRVDLSGIQMMVSGVDPITITRKMTENPVGEQRDYQKMPAGWELSNIVLHVDESKAQQLKQWYQQFVVQGNNGQNQEKTLTVSLLDQSMKPVLTLQFDGVGIVSLAREATSAGSEQIQRLRAEFYAERVSINGGGGGGGGGGMADNAAGDSNATPSGGDTAASPTGGAATPAQPAATAPAVRKARRPAKVPAPG